MTVKTYQQELYQRDTGEPDLAFMITIGTVVDTNDPQQAGRVRAVCPRLGDVFQSPVEDIPWAVYCSPMAGQVAIGTRGPGIQTSEGGIGYGIWAVPKVGAKVAVLCVDGDPRHRIFIGGIHDQFTTHTMPHGRWFYDDHPALEKADGDTIPFGPMTSRESGISPLTQNYRQAFGVAPNNATNFERQTRAADYAVSRIDVSQLGVTVSNVQDDKDVKVGNWTSTQGYQVSRIDPHAPTTYTDKNYDNQILAITSPGFHAFSMDDRQENCRMRLRTTAGHQIIMDDTNERIYISTAKGENWIEMDQNGNIDMFSTNKISIHSADTLNLTSSKDVRIYGQAGVDIRSGAEMKLSATNDLNLTTGTNFRVQANSDAFVQAGGTLNVLAGGNLDLTSNATVNILGGGNIIGSASQIHWNGPSAEPASPAGAKVSSFTNRIPQHEPWPRGMTKKDDSMEPEFGYDSNDVNRVERGKTYTRGYFWRR